MKAMEWNDGFMTLLRDAVARYHERPQTSPVAFFLPAEVKLLREIGYTPEEMHAYVQDYAVNGDPSPSTILLIAAARRTFFMTAQRGISGNAKPVKARDLPPADDDFQGIPYLPRIIRKAEAKLHGTLDANLMYYDEQDRIFLREHGNIHPADFLYLAWTAHGDKQKMVKAVLNAMKADSPEDEAPRITPTIAPQQPSRSTTPSTESGPVQSELKLD
ncbi:MAG: hypothetical protein IKJ58_07300 [Akkermansia sp.]|nr:hypothetical protein [Akkermansia sp.]